MPFATPTIFLGFLLPWVWGLYSRLLQQIAAAPYLEQRAEYIMRNAELDEAQAGIKIGERNINNLRHADDTTCMAESEEELKSLLMKVQFSSVAQSCPNLCDSMNCSMPGLPVHHQLPESIQIRVH